MRSSNVSKGKMIAGIAGICIATLLVIFAFCGRYAEGGFKQFGNFFLGSFGMAFYGLMAAVIVICSFILAGKTIKIPVKYVIHFALMFLAVVLLVHLLTTTYLSDEYYNEDGTGYVQYVYNYYGSQTRMGVPTFGGVVFGSIAYALKLAITIYGALILVVALLGWTIYVAGDFFYSYFTGKLTLNARSSEEIEPSVETKSARYGGTPQATDPRQRAMDILYGGQIYPEEVSTTHGVERIDVSQQSGMSSTFGRSEAEQILFGGGVTEIRQTPSNASPSAGDVNTPDDDFIIRGYYGSSADTAPATPSAPVEVEEQEPEQTLDWKVKNPDSDKTYVVDDSSNQSNDQSVVSQADASQVIDIVDITSQENPVEQSVEQPASVDEDQPVLVQEAAPEQEEDDDEIVVVPKEKIIETSEGSVIQTGMDFVPRGELKEQENENKHVPYVQPPMELLSEPSPVDDFEADDRQRAAEAIVNKLSVFGIKVEIANIIVGPSVSRYMFNVLSQKTRMSEFARFSDDIKACIEAQEDIRIEAPVHGTNQVGIEVANKVKTPVVLRSLLESDTFKNADGKLVFAIGQEITGKVIVADLADMPHLLIAGTTGSGKSVCLNCLIVSLMYRYGPEYVRFVMVDPKFVELSRYNGIPHMLTSEAITNTNDAIAGLDYLISEMETRYQLFRSSGVGNISEYNSRINPNTTQKLPYMVFIVDELADLMAASKQAFESKLQRLAQKSRAAGIHIVLATQRPDVKTITGTIKANLPCRMALKVASIFDSNTIIGGGGAEKLLGKGDMLFLSSTSPDLERVQGAYVSNDEIRSLVEFSKESNEVYYDDKISEEIFVSRKQAEEAAAEQQREKDNPKETQLDPLCKKALRFWLEKQAGRASIASIQRNLGIGFNRAGRIMNSLQELKYVEELPPDAPNSKPLKVLVTLDELDDLFPDQEDE